MQLKSLIMSSWRWHGWFEHCSESLIQPVGSPVWSLCNELGKGRPRLETGATDDGLSGFSKNKQNPVMVYNDLMIRNITVHNYNKDRSQPVTIQCLYTWVGAPVDRRRHLPQPCSDLGSDYSSFLPYGFSPTICCTSVNISYRYCLITLVT